MSVPLVSFRVEHLTKTYRRLTALADVSLSVRPGEVLGLIGPNGAGKTTLFECMAGVLAHDSGAVLADGRPLTVRDRASRIFYLPDAIAPWPSQTLRWVLDFTIGFFGGRAHLRSEVIGRLQLAPFLDAPVGTLSKGQRKRAVLAVGLLTPHELLLADEPFDGLDLRQTREVASALRDHASAGRTLFLSIHQISDAARVCDRFVLLSGGRVCGEGTIEELARRANQNPKNPENPENLRTSRTCSLRSPKSPFVWLLEKEWRELLASRAWWVLLVVIGPLVGVSFIAAVRTYGELSGYGGTSEGVGEAFSPLVGIWAPTFSAFELGAAFLLPFVAIRVVAGDRQSGALKLELQQPMPVFWRVGAKGLVLLAGWAIASLPAIAAIVLWRSYGGSVYPPELVSVVIGHFLNAGLTVALAAAAASVTEHPSTAAILTLSVTVGTWIISFIASVHGGAWETAAGYTPTAMVAEFQHGLIRLDVVLIALLLTAAGLVVSAIWMRLGVSPRRRASEAVAALAVAAAAIVACALLRPSWDLSESRMNSFPRHDEATLRQIHEPLRIEAHLAVEDPRRMDLERQALSKLRRIMPRLQVQYIANTSTGLFEQSSRQYGEIWYELGGRRIMNRGTTAESVLETIYALAGITVAEAGDEEIFRGHPLAVPPRRAGAVFYGIWPALIVAAGVFYRRRQ